MGFSVSGATAVVFVGLLVSAATLYPVVERSLDRRSDALSAQNERALTQQNTALGTLNATYNATSDVLTVSVENTGARTLAVTEVDLLVDGQYDATGLDTTVDGDSTTDVWAPGERLTLTRSEPATPAQVKLVTGPGVATTATVEGV